jgi:hypothetical protein
MINLHLDRLKRHEQFYTLGIPTQRYRLISYIIFTQPATDQYVSQRV